MTAVMHYAAGVDAAYAPRVRLHGQQLPDDRWGGETAPADVRADGAKARR